MNDKTNKVMELLKLDKISNGELSPNYVNQFAWSKGIEDLTSKEVVYIADNYYHIDPCGHKRNIDKQNKNMPEEMRDIMN